MKDQSKKKLIEAPKDAKDKKESIRVPTQDKQKGRVSAKKMVEIESLFIHTDAIFNPTVNDNGLGR